MKLKSVPEDFVVDEVFDLKLKKKGDYVYFLLNKTNWTTQRAILQIARRLRITKRRMGFAGNKDKKAVTSQAISIFGLSREAVEKVRLKDIKLEFLGYGDEPINLGDLENNKFKIKVGLSKFERENLNNRLNLIKKFGFVNYFGGQRFSSGGSSRIGKGIVLGDFESAIKAFLSIHSKEVKYFDDYVLNNWGEWKSILSVAPKFLGMEKNVLNYLVLNPTDFAGALRRIPKPTRRLFVHALQSEIWNRALSKYLASKVEVKWINLPGHKIAIPIDEVKIEKKLSVSGFDTKPTGEFKKFVDDEMKREKVDYDDFRCKSMPELSAGGVNRDVFVKVRGLKIKDDWISFELGKGTYATVLLSNLTLSSHNP